MFYIESLSSLTTPMCDKIVPRFSFTVGHMLYRHSLSISGMALADIDGRTGDYPAKIQNPSPSITSLSTI